MNNQKKLSLKRFLYRAYLIFDLIVFPAFVLGFISCFDGVWGEWFNYYMLTVTLYLCINSILGIVLCKKKFCTEESSSFSKNWMAGMYIANTLGVFSLFMPVCQLIDTLNRKMFDYALGEFAISFAILLMLVGQPKWQRAVVYNAGTPKFFKMCISIANPIRALFQMIMLFAITVPVI